MTNRELLHTINELRPGVRLVRVNSNDVVAIFQLPGRDGWIFLENIITPVSYIRMYQREKHRLYRANVRVDLSRSARYFHVQ